MPSILGRFTVECTSVWNCLMLLLKSVSRVLLKSVSSARGNHGNLNALALCSFLPCNVAPVSLPFHTVNVFSYHIYLFILLIYVCVCGWTKGCVAWLCRSEDNFWGLVLSFHLCGIWSLGGQCLNLLNHLAGPVPWYFVRSHYGQSTGEVWSTFWRA